MDTCQLIAPTMIASMGDTDGGTIGVAFVVVVVMVFGGGRIFSVVACDGGGGTFGAC